MEPMRLSNQALTTLLFIMEETLIYQEISLRA